MTVAWTIFSLALRSLLNRRLTADIITVDDDTALGGFFQPGNNPKQGRLSTT